MRVYLDTNVLADMVMRRDNEQDNYNALTILQLSSSRKFEFCTSALSIATLYYLLRRSSDAKVKIKKIISAVAIIPIGHDDVRFSVFFDFPDSEDAMHMSCAANGNCELIITRNIKDYCNSPIPALCPAEFLERISK